MELLFNTEYHYYEHDLSGGYRIACDEYHLPQSVREHVDFAVGSLLIKLGNVYADLGRKMPTIQLEGMSPVPK